MTHTPGPWTISGWAIRMSGGHKLANFDMMPDKANARLIAAAPELLEACEATLDALTELIGADYDLTGEQAKLRAAIAKAKGEA